MADRTKRQHEDDVRGRSNPFEPADGVTLRRIITGVMGIAVSMLIFAVVALGLHYNSESNASDKARVVAARERQELKEQLAASTAAITALLDQQAGGAEARAEALKAAVAQVVLAQQQAIEAQFKLERAASAAEATRLLNELKRLQAELSAKLERIVAGPPGPQGRAGAAGPAGINASCQLVCL